MNCLQLGNAASFRASVVQALWRRSLHAAHERKPLLIANQHVSERAGCPTLLTRKP